MLQLYNPDQPDYKLKVQMIDGRVEFQIVDIDGRLEYVVAQLTADGVFVRTALDSRKKDMAVSAGLKVVRGVDNNKPCYFMEGI